MAFCPKCKGEMPALAVRCPNCWFDFPAERPDRSSGGFAYSPLADLALTISAVAAGFGAFVAVLVAVAAIAQGQFFAGLIVAPLASLLNVGMLVTFLRVSR